MSAPLPSDPATPLFPILPKIRRTHDMALTLALPPIGPIIPPMPIEVIDTVLSLKHVVKGLSTDEVLILLLPQTCRVPYSDGLVQTSTDDKVLSWVELSAHNIMIMS